MSASALALVLGAAIIHAFWNFVAKKSGGSGHYVLMCSLMVTLVWAPVALWVGVQQVGQWGALAWALIGASALAHILYFRALLHGYAVSDLTVVYPVARGSGPLLSTVGAVLLLGEPLSLVAALGAVAVVAGVFLVAGGPGLWQQARDPQLHQRVVLGVRWGALTGIMIAAYTVVDAFAVKVLLLSPLLVDYMGNVLRVPLMLPTAWRDPSGFRQAWARQWRSALVIGIFSPLSYIMVLYAMRLAPLSHVAPAREVSMLFAALLGGSLLGESQRWLRLAGAACMAAGVVALALG